jgi:hypothetical protein
MLVAFTYCQKDSAIALAGLQWIAEMGGVGDHSMLLTVPEGVDYKEHKAAAESAFSKVTMNVIDDVSSGWPFGANHAWKRTVDFIDHFKMGAFLFMEADAIALYPEWLDDIEDEYKAAGKPFMGFREYKADPSRTHMNGVGVYRDIYQLAPLLMSAPTPSDLQQVGENHMAFDWAGKDEVVPLMHESKLFQFQYKKEDALMLDESLSWIDRDAAIFHTCKNPRFIELLRSKKQGGQAKSRPAHNREIAGSNPAPAIVTDIFIKTYDKVADWHAFAMRSIEKYCTGFRRTVVIGQQPVEGYQEMQVVKLNADLYTDADLILFTDSDCIFSRSVTPETYMRDGKPIWLHRSWESALKQEGDAVMKWHRGMCAFFDSAPPREFMCRHPELVPRWLLIAFRQFCKARHGVTLEQWILKDKQFADWNMLGMYAWMYHRECFHWIDQDAEPPPPMTLKQYWGGHTPIEPNIPEIERIIGGGVEVVHVGNEKHTAPSDGWDAVPEAPKASMDILSKYSAKVTADELAEKERKEKVNARMAKARAARKKARA